MDGLLQLMIAVITSLVASSGFWAFVQKRGDKKDGVKQMLIGLGHDRIIALGLSYLERGDWITQDEYENLHDYLYVPYRGIGGNGSAERVMQDIDKLRIVPSNYNRKGENQDEKEI